MDGVGKFVWVVCVGFGVLVALAAYPVIHFYGFEFFVALVAGASIGVVVIVFTVVANAWAISRSSRDFFRVLLGGMLVRFLFVGLILFVFWKFVRIDFLTFVTAFIGSYLLLHYVEIKFLQKRFLSKKETAA